jgi:lipopolysaccharide export LptBFGC system permease protein LptF
MTGQERWERLASGLLWIAGLFVVFTIYEVFIDDGDLRGAVMTIIPAILMFAVSRYAAYRRDR